MTLFLGFSLALGISLAAKWKKSLNRSGAIAATLMGTIIFGLGGIPWAILLLLFFLSSSLLSRFKKKNKLVYDEKFSKTSERDIYQVFANGGLAMLLVLIHTINPDNNWTWLLYAASLAAANADTWATELGVLSQKAPRLITNGSPVEPGTSGAITTTGTLASTAGAAMIALPAIFLWQGNLPPAGLMGLLAVFFVITLAGLSASLTDSLLGATIQAIYYCSNCKKETERHPYHTCNTETIHQKGLSWLDNDWVNFFATCSGAIMALLLAGLLSFSNVFQLDGKLSQQNFVVSTSAFENGGRFIEQFTCFGANQPIDLSWDQLPENTQAVLITMHDMDTPMGRIPHWLATAEVNSKNTSTEQMDQWIHGNNYAGEAQYTGPCPPIDPPHRYVVHIYALKESLALHTGFNWTEAANQLPDHVLAESSIVGKFSR